MQFFHINHGCDDYRDGHVITLRPFVAPESGDVATWTQMEQSWNPQFPGGFSMWGLRLLYNQMDNADISDRELDCEMFRGKHFPSRPSRFQSIFAVETLEEAIKFRGQANKPASIWLIEAVRPSFKGDMRHLGFGVHKPETFKAYWEGQPANGGEPIWEHLLVPPVTLVRCVSESE